MQEDKKKGKGGKAKDEPKKGKSKKRKEKAEKKSKAKKEKKQKDVKDEAAAEADDGAELRKDALKKSKKVPFKGSPWVWVRSSVCAQTCSRPLGRQARLKHLEAILHCWGPFASVAVTTLQMTLKDY